MHPTSHPLKVHQGHHTGRRDSRRRPHSLCLAKTWYHYLDTADLNRLRVFVVDWTYFAWENICENARKL